MFKNVSLLLLLFLLLPYTIIAQEKDSTSEDLEHIKGVLNDLNESATEYKNYVDILRKIKFTGYVQAQFRSTDLNGTSTPFSGGNFPANTNKQFQIRRGRFKLNYDNILTQYVLQIDATTAGLSLKDAYVSVIEPWLQSFGVQLGLFDRPFGYEISFSSGVRESPERSRLFQTLFPGERDLGAKVFYAPQIGDLSFLRVDAGIFNGTGSVASDFDNFKDFIGHAAVQIPFEEANASLDLGVSGYFGKVRNNTKYLWKNGEPSPGVKGFILDSAVANQSAGVARSYLGFDFQFYYDVPVLGGMSLRGEIITGEQPGTSDSVRAGNGIKPTGKSLTSVSPSAQALGPIYRRNMLGWYISYVQNIGNNNQLIVKYDVYDPNSDVVGDDFVTGTNLSATDLKVSTLGLGIIHHWDEYVKFVLYYEIVKNEKVNPAVAGTASLAPYLGDIQDNVLTFRTQFRF